MRLLQTWFSVASATLILSYLQQIHNPTISKVVAQSATGSSTVLPENSQPTPPAPSSTGSETTLPEYDDRESSGDGTILPEDSKENESNSAAAERLFKQATEQFRNRQYAEALQTYQQVLAIRQQKGDRLGTGEILQQIGAVYDRLGQYSQALNYYQQALTLRQQIDNKVGIGSTLNSIGSVYQQQGNFRRALQFYEQALAIRQQVNDTPGVGRTLNNIGLVYNQLGQYPRAIEFYQQALKIFQTINNPTGVGAILNNIGLVKTQLGQYDQAIKSYEQALSVRQQINDKAGVGTTLHNIGFVYDKQNNPHRALEFYQQALVIRTEAGDKAGVGATLNNIGFIRAILQQQSQALTSLNQALAIFQQIGDKAGEGRTIDSIGTAYKIFNNSTQALGYYQQALVIQREVGDLDGERITLRNIGEVLEQQKQHSLAIIVYKQSVNVTEAIRKDLRVLEASQQESYTTTISDTYRALASLLLNQNRVVEGQQILDLLKVQELDDYLRNVPSHQQTTIGIELLPIEQQILAKYSAIQGRLASISKELTVIRQISPQSRSVAQKQRLSQLEQQLQQILQVEFNQFTNSPEVVALVQQLNQSLRTQNPKLPNFNYLQQQLKTLDAKAALLYPLILEDRLEIVLITANSPPVHRSIPVKRTELKQAVADFRAALTNRKLSARRVMQPANKLYNWLIAPIEKDLAEAGVNSIIYAPDGQLRYVPLAALYDGKQWLVERYSVNNITAASLIDFSPQPLDAPKILAAAFTTGSYNFNIGANHFEFVGLPFAGKEVAQIADLVPGTTKLLDGNFNRAATVPNLSNYNIIHLATHAAFVKGQPEESFILFGNGDRATLRDIAQWKLTANLVVLSACQTGVGGQLGNGEEILGLGYQMQQAGAKATIASLWVVDDEATQQLMNAFYQSLPQKFSKAETLRQAQLTLINQSFGSRNAHPYYWASFILIGNGFVLANDVGF